MYHHLLQLWIALQLCTTLFVCWYGSRLEPLLIFHHRCILPAVSACPPSAQHLKGIMIRHLLKTSLRPLNVTHHNLTTTTTTTTTPHLCSSSVTHYLYRHFATFQIVVPNLGDSITEGTIAELTKHAGDDVSTDEVIARLETDKVSIDVRSTGSGKISAVNVKQGDTVHVGDVLFEGDDAASGGGGGGKQQQQQPAAASKDSAAVEKPAQPAAAAAAPTKTQAIDSAHTQTAPHDTRDTDTDDSHPHRAHHPLIQFRYGRRSSQSATPAQPADKRKQPTQVPASSAAQPNKPSTSTQQSQQSAQQQAVRGMQPDAYFNLSDFARVNEAAATARQQLPAYYRRKVWSEAEQDVVMMGGAPNYIPKAMQKEKDKAAAAAGGKKK